MTVGLSAIYLTFSGHQLDALLGEIFCCRRATNCLFWNAALAENERALISTRTRQAISAAQARGVTLGNPKLHTAPKSAVEAVKAKADRYAANCASRSFERRRGDGMVRQENFSRPVSITFRRCGTTSNVRVTSSPSLARQAIAATTRARGRRIDHHALSWQMLGEALAVRAPARKSRTTVVLATARSAASSQSMAFASSSSNVSANCTRDDRSDRATTVGLAHAAQELHQAASQRARCTRRMRRPGQVP